MKKKVVALALAAVAAGSCFSLAACDDISHVWTGEYVTITCLDANGEEIEKAVPLNPERVAILDFAALDIIDAFDEGDTVVASAEGTISYLQDYWDDMDDGDITNIGQLKSFSLEAIQQSEPDIIFIGGRQSSYYEKLEEIATVVYLSTTNGTVVEDTLTNVATIGAIFGKTEEEINSVIASYNIDSRITALSSFSTKEDGTAKTCLKLMWNNVSSFSVLAENGNCSIIDNELGFSNLNQTYTDSQHGSSTSWEAIASTNPDYLFVLNRAYVTSGGGGTSQEEAPESVAKEIQETLSKFNKFTGKVIVLTNSDVWYTAQGGIQALDVMLSDLEEAFEISSDY